MKQEVNIFGDRICVKEDCPAFSQMKNMGSFVMRSWILLDCCSPLVANHSAGCCANYR